MFSPRADNRPAPILSLGGALRLERIARLASRFSIPDSTRFAIDLGPEEVLPNIIRHGYSGKPDHSIDVPFSKLWEDFFVFVVEDQAPPFNPVDSPDPSLANSLDQSQIGGRKIR